ncbi:MAG: hypothetical protein KDB50_13325 [Mycobacterium sp.]|nr:hypothetical protein [Mycobacterium sp.]
MTKRRTIVVLVALVGAVIGAVLGVLVTPQTVRHGAWAHIVLVPPAELTSAEASSFWEVLTGGQISRTAAILYSDARWLPAAAAAAGVSQSQLDVAAYALPETTMLVVTAQADTQAAADSALDSVLTTATPEVSSVLSPYFVKVLQPQQDDPITGPGKKQFAAAGGLGGLLVCGGLGWLFVRRRLGSAIPVGDGPALLGEDPSSR